MIDLSATHDTPIKDDLERMIAEKIHSFADLPDGWHYGIGTGAVGAAVDAALNVNSLLVDYGARNIEVFPGVDGSVLVSGYRSRDTLEILCRPTGGLGLVYEVDETTVDERPSISMDDVEEFLGGLEWLPQNLFVRCTQSISAEKKTASLAWPSNPHPGMEGYQYLRQNAPLTVVDANVAIFINFTGASLDISMFSGGSILIFSQMIAGLPVSRPRQATPATGISMAWEIINAESW